MVKIPITPIDSQYLLDYQERQSNGVLDHIFHKIVALDDCTTQFYIISSDICLYSPSEYDKVAAMLQKRFGMDPLNVCTENANDKWKTTNDKRSLWLSFCFTRSMQRSSARKENATG